MITNITLENFKCFRKVEVNPKLVTLFIGPNGTGKSGVLQALLLLKQSEDAGERLDLSGPLVSVSSEDLALESHGPQSTTLSMFDPLHSPGQQTTTVHLSLRGKPFHNVSKKPAASPKGICSRLLVFRRWVTASMMNTGLASRSTDTGLYGNNSPGRFCNSSERCPCREGNGQGDLCAWAKIVCDDTSPDWRAPESLNDVGLVSTLVWTGQLRRYHSRCLNGWSG